MTRRVPAIVGGEPIRPDLMRLVSPTLEVGDPVIEDIRAMLASGEITNGRHVAAFERQVAEYLGVPDVVAVSSATAGLMMVLRCLGLSGEVVLPSFTFIASGQALLWNGLDPVFADVGAATYTLDPERADAAMGSRCAALLAVHTFGSPCDIAALTASATARGIPVVVDAAHGFGARYPDGTNVGGGGTAEVFSLSPTKPFAVGEGGLVATGRDLAAELRIARNYGNPGNYDSLFLGLNGRMLEVSAIIGRYGLPELPSWLRRRRRLAQRYRDNLGRLPGIGFQHIPAGAQSVHKDFVVTVEASAFGLHRDLVAAALAAENIPTRTYFAPPLHRQTSFRATRKDVELPVTDWLAARTLTLPLYSHMPEALVDQVCEAIHGIHRHAERIAELGR